MYVLEVGCYEQSAVAGVFSTPERAMAAHSPTKPSSPVFFRPRNADDSYTWSPEEPEEGFPLRWLFDADWDDYACVTEMELDPV